MAMLGDKIGEEQGKVSAVRIVGSDVGPKMEVLFQGGGQILGHGVSDIVTYRNQMRPDGLFYGTADGVVFTEDAQGASYTGTGIGRMLGRGGAAEWRGSLIFQTASPKLAALNGIVVLFEFEIDETGMNMVTNLWEWK
jgi:hypothetical protein